MVQGRRQTVRGFVLAGGASARFGRDKALVEFDGRPMLLRMRDLVRGVLGRVTVIARPGKYTSIGVESVADRWPGEGPLGGILTALLSNDSSERLGWNLVVGCDMPFLTRDCLGFLAKQATASDAEVLVPRSASGLEPLCACWRASTAEKLRKIFDSGTRKITDAMKQFKMEIVDEPDWKRFDSTGRLFWNMNTVADYQEARRILEAKQA